MSAIKTGGPAFPFTVKWTDFRGEEKQGTESGMTLRDWFAGQIMIGFLPTRSMSDYEYFAEEAYKLADAMLKEREKEPEL